MKKYQALMVLGWLALASSPALAHARLEKSDPAAGAKRAASVAEINLHYSEALEPAFSNATLSDATDHLVDATSSVDAKDASHMVLTPKQPLGPGTYQLQWRVVSVDTHKTQGSFKFEVVP
ncbi:MAG: copper homeostasis periplasmic binding protein CopC [Parvibaculaceae bacterium]